MWLKDPKTNKPSVTMTMMFIGFIVAVLKLLLSGIEYDAFKAGSFTGTDFAAVVASLGSIYSFRKYTDKDKER